MFIGSREAAAGPVPHLRPTSKSEQMMFGGLRFGMVCRGGEASGRSEAVGALRQPTQNETPFRGRTSSMFQLSRALRVRPRNLLCPKQAMGERAEIVDAIFILSMLPRGGGADPSPPPAEIREEGFMRAAARDGVSLRRELSPGALLGAEVAQHAADQSS